MQVHVILDNGDDPMSDDEHLRSILLVHLVLVKWNRNERWMQLTSAFLTAAQAKGEEFVDFAFPEESELKVEKPRFFRAFFLI